MSTTIRPEITQKSPYYITKHERYMLVHYCLQFPDWKKEYAQLQEETIRGRELYFVGNKNIVSDPSAELAVKRAEIAFKIRTIEKTAKETDQILAPYIIKAVTEGYSYNYLRTTLRMPCSKEYYFKLYRKFFWLLNRKIFTPYYEMNSNN